MPPREPNRTARLGRAEDLGYSTLLMPDGMQLLSPLPALALAAGATTSLRAGTFVLASRCERRGWRPGHGSSCGQTWHPYMASLIAHDSLLIPRGAPRQMAGELQRRRDGLGISYISVNAAFTE